MRHIQDSQNPIMALTFRQQSSAFRQKSARSVPKKPRVSGTNARHTCRCVGPGYLRMIKSLLSACLEDQATSFLEPPNID